MLLIDWHRRLCKRIHSSSSSFCFLFLFGFVLLLGCCCFLFASFVCFKFGLQGWVFLLLSLDSLRLARQFVIFLSPFNAVLLCCSPVHPPYYIILDPCRIIHSCDVNNKRDINITVKPTADV